jgi:hypothetical protein
VTPYKIKHNDNTLFPKPLFIRMLVIFFEKTLPITRDINGMPIIDTPASLPIIIGMTGTTMPKPILIIIERTIRL